MRVIGAAYGSQGESKQQWYVGYEVELSLIAPPMPSFTQVFQFYPEGDSSKWPLEVRTNYVNVSYMAHNCTTVLVGVYGVEGFLFPPLIVRGTVPSITACFPILEQTLDRVTVSIQSTGSGLFELQMTGFARRDAVGGTQPACELTEWRRSLRSEEGHPKP